ncbi:MAG: prephenate dehydratase [Candidatus Micrarchaeia archaeon]
MRMAFLGPEGTFTHIAARKAFPKARLIPLEAIDEIFSAVERGKAEAGVVPIENSTEGSVNATLDLLLRTPLKVSGELKLPVVHHLLAKPGVKLAEVKAVIAHPQALAQCKEFLEKKLPGAERREASSTAKACQLLDRRSAAIASALAARIYGLRFLAKNIQDSPDNTTRFVVIAKSDSEKPSGKDKTSLVFSVEDKPGALLRALHVFADRGINLTKIESRPSREKSWEYVFFADFEGHRLEPKPADALRALEGVTTFVKILGSYKKAA